MITIPDHIAGVVFDVDETLLDTNVKDPVNGFHEQARLQAAHEVGRSRNIPELINLTPELNLEAFLTAPVHTLESTVWNSLLMLGLESSQQMDPDSPLLKEIVARKDELFEDILRTQGKPIPGAVAFIERLAAMGLENHLAIASTSIRRDIDIFLEASGLKRFFPDERIITKADVTHAKPNPEAFDKAFKTLGLSENDRQFVLAFEDNPRGVVSAKGAGLFTCAITTVQSRETLVNQPIAPDLVADSFEEFTALLKLT
jgi:HAD superfamily hydrolase (TIGR01509 family)